MKIKRKRDCFCGLFFSLIFPGISAENPALFANFGYPILQKTLRERRFRAASFCPLIGEISSEPGHKESKYTHSKGEKIMRQKKFRNPKIAGFVTGMLLMGLCCISPAFGFSAMASETIVISEESEIPSRSCADDTEIDTEGVDELTTP